MAPYKGPVEPGIAFGGYAKPEAGKSINYKLSTGITLTYLINNSKNKTALQPALEWELKFIQFLKTYQSDKMEIAFNAERSVQDAIEELSESEGSTVLISYSVMFIYVAVSLGSFKSFYTLLVWMHSFTVRIVRSFIRFLLGSFKIDVGLRWDRNCYWIGDMQFGRIRLHSFGHNDANH